VAQYVILIPLIYCVYKAQSVYVAVNCQVQFQNTVHEAPLSKSTPISGGVPADVTSSQTSTVHRYQLMLSGNAVNICNAIRTSLARSNECFITVYVAAVELVDIVVLC